MPIIGSMPISSMLVQIETEEDYREALKRFLEICANPKDSEDERELCLLMDLMEKYERNNCSFT